MKKLMPWLRKPLPLELTLSFGSRLETLKVCGKKSSFPNFIHGVLNSAPRKELIIVRTLSQSPDTRGLIRLNYVVEL